MKRFIAEFQEQSFTQIIFPHAKSDWVDYLEEAQETFANIINAIIRYQKCLVVCDDVESKEPLCTDETFCGGETNDMGEAVLFMWKMTTCCLILLRAWANLKLQR
jgi:agmatine/peptidylarginine deiminase